MSEKPRKRAVIYARYSSDNQRSESIDEQVRACKYFAQHSGQYDIVGIYKDEALSGYRNIHKRDGFTKLMQDAEAHKFDAVIVYELSRFARNASDTVVYTDKLKQLGIEFISVREKLDQTPEGRMMLLVITGVNEYFSANLAIEVMRGLKENAYKAKTTGGKPPLGYDLDKDGHYILNPTEAEAVRLMYDMYLAGYGYTRIVDELNSRGYRTKLGGKFLRNSIYDLLRNEKYTGTFVYNKTAQSKNGKQNRHKYKSDEDVIRVEDAFPAIITKEEYKEVLRKMEKNQRKGGRNSATHEYLLSGKVYCGHCGKSMFGETRARRGHEYSYYSCNGHRAGICDKHSVRCDKLEKEVIRQLNERYFSLEVEERVVAKILEANKNGVDEAKILQLRGQSAELKRQIDNLVNAVAKGMDFAEVHEKIADLTKQKQAIDRRIVDAEAAAYNVGYTAQQIRKVFEDNTDLTKLPRERLKQLIQKFVWRIYVYDGDSPNDPDKVKIIMVPNAQAQTELDTLAEDYVALTDFLSNTGGGALPLPFVLDNGVVIITFAAVLRTPK